MFIFSSHANIQQPTFGFLFHFIVPLSCSEGFTELGYYNGTVSQTDSGSPCLKWTEFPDYVQQYPGRGLGEHNYCRNPDRESNPWCFFRQSSGAIGWAYCDCHQGKTNCPTAPSSFYHDLVVLFLFTLYLLTLPKISLPRNLIFKQENTIFDKNQENRQHHFTIHKLYWFKF